MRLRAGSYSGRCLCDDSEETPNPRHAFELVFASVREADARAADKIHDGSRYKDLTRFGQRYDPSANVDRYTSDVVATQLDFTGMKSRAYFDSELAGTFTYRASALDGAGGTVERDEEPVTHRLDLSPSKPGKLAPHHGVMGVEAVLPCSIAKIGRSPRGVEARSAGCEWLHVDFGEDMAAFYFGACGFRPTAAGLIRLHDAQD